MTAFCISFELSDTIGPVKNNWTSVVDIDTLIMFCYFNMPTIIFIVTNVTYIPNFLIYMAVTFVTINIIDLRQFWATVLAAIAGVPVTFTLMKLITFKKPTK